MQNVHCLTLTLKSKKNLYVKISQSLLFILGFTYLQHSFADDLSYQQAEQQTLSHSYSTQASQNLQRASQLNAEAVKHAGRPNINFNVRAYAFRAEQDVPLTNIKNNINQSVSQNLNRQISTVGSQLGMNSDAIAQISQIGDQNIADGINNLIPDQTNVVVKDHDIRPTVSVIMPLYTGGIISATKNLAALQATRGELTVQQQQDNQRFEVIQNYFNVQLQKKLVDIAQFNVNAMQKHVSNAVKLEQQGFISKGQRMPFEVAYNNSLRTLDALDIQLKQSYFTLQQLLQNEQTFRLITPLFINSSMSQPLVNIFHQLDDKSTLLRKMQMDTQLADQNIKLQRASQKPSVYAFGEYVIDHKENWVVGVAAKYNIFSGIDHKKQVQAAQLQRDASALATERAKQELQNLIFKAYTTMESAQHTHRLLQENMQAAQENLRIQTLSFKENMGTATQVIDAENVYHAMQAESAMNAYKYILALAALLQANGSIEQFPQYINQSNTISIH
ncbi:TolC family protein [Acinetobacter sp. B5B]|uniref:TolC family protein n=1 Tax=Acinetobacter baretiae TaxID=2605383 RepID=UPI0018C2806D|nr:TolC family protein [Acinetobacter baretiae]MBF7682682.1 TolC family protein [Acinetobacter baretiae]MBF7684916.1 TolC family protein [Acinetobacter baretiae]